MAFWRWLTIHGYLFTTSHKPTLITLTCGSYKMEAHPLEHLLQGHRCHPLLHHPCEPHWPSSTRPDKCHHHQCPPVSSDQWEEPPYHLQDNVAPATWSSARWRPGSRQFWTGRPEFRKAVLPHDQPHCLRGPATVLTVYLRKQPDRTNTVHQSAAFAAGHVRPDSCQQSGPSADKKGPWCYWAC